MSLGLFRKLAFTALMLAAVQTSAPVWAKADAQVLGFETVSVAELPRQGKETYQRIVQGGPFPYEKDGTVFGNRERLLPLRQRGYYREYTVSEPGAHHRGTQRIVCGGPPKAPDNCFLTTDHYASFRRIVP